MDQVIDGKYLVVRELGKGGMGAVYEARHEGTGRRVALKVIVSEALAKEADVLARFQREARASGAIDSRHVVQVLDSGVDPATSSPYLVMEYLSGRDLLEVIRRSKGTLSPDVVLRIAAQACSGLSRAHDAGIIHRDIKSANLFLARADDGEIVVKILDFGIAKVRADSLASRENHQLTRTGSMLGSPLYMSPEQARGSKSLDARADLWSLGVVMYEALCGVTPNHQCETLGDLILAICSEDARPVQERAPWVPFEVAAIVEQALSRDPDRRFASADDMRAAITALLPDGTRIDEKMLEPVSAEERARTAPRPFARTETRPNAISGPSPRPLGASSGAVSASPAATTTAGVGTSGGVVSSPPARRAPRAVVLGALPVLALVGVGAVYVARSASPSQVVQAEPPSSRASSAPVDSPPPPPPAPVAPREVVVTVAVSPPDAAVVVDGAPATARDGSVELLGAIGSVHKIELRAGGRTTTADVVIAESGPVPARVEIAPAATTSSGRVGKPSPPRPSGAPSGAAGDSTKPASTPKVPTEPAIERTF